MRVERRSAVPVHGWTETFGRTGTPTILRNTYSLVEVFGTIKVRKAEPVLVTIAPHVIPRADEALVMVRITTNDHIQHVGIYQAHQSVFEEVERLSRNTKGKVVYDTGSEM